MQASEIGIGAKKSRLEAELRQLGRVLVAYSGGVDSAYLAWATHRALGASMLAVIADSPSLARTHLNDAIAFAKEQNIPIEVISTSELDRPEYARNDGQRCFQCKDELFVVMEKLREARGFDAIAYGVNFDDQGDFRPGQQAAKQHHVAAPLLKAGLTKQEIRELARQFANLLLRQSSLQERSGDMVLLCGLLPGAEVALIVEVHPVRNGVEAPRFAQFLHHDKQLIFTLKAALSVVARIFRTVEFGRRDDFYGNVLFLGKSDGIVQVSSCQAGRVGNHRQHTSSKRAVSCPG